MMRKILLCRIQRKKRQARRKSELRQLSRLVFFIFCSTMLIEFALSTGGSNRIISFVVLLLLDNEHDIDGGENLMSVVCDWYDITCGWWKMWKEIFTLIDGFCQDRLWQEEIASSNLRWWWMLKTNERSYVRLMLWGCSLYLIFFKILDKRISLSNYLSMGDFVDRRRFVRMDRTIFHFHFSFVISGRRTVTILSKRISDVASRRSIWTFYSSDRSSVVVLV